MSRAPRIRGTVRAHSFWGVPWVCASCVINSDTVTMDIRSFEVLTKPSSTPIPIEVGTRHSAFHLDVSADASVAVDRVLDPSGTVVLDYRDFPSPRLLTQGIIPIGTHSSFNWPIREGDAPLRFGTWTVEVAAIDAQDQYVEGIPLTVTLQKKMDTDWSRGKVRIRVVFDETSDADPAVRSATEQAVLQWKDIYRNAGIQLYVRYDSEPLGLDLDTPSDDTLDYAGFENPEETSEISLVVGHYIDGGLDLFGISGGVPGAIAEVSPWCGTGVMVGTGGQRRSLSATRSRFICRDFGSRGRSLSWLVSPG